MYIKKICIHNIRCIEDLYLDFTKPGSSKLILGENGDGKSTILRCIAMGLCDESSASALFRELPGEFVRRPKGRRVVPKGAEGSITIDLDAGSGNIYRVTTRIESLTKFERVYQEVERYSGGKKVEKEINQSNFPWHKIFVASYGPGLRTRANMDFQHYLPVDAVYPLFSYETPLQNPHNVLLKLMAGAREKAESEIIKSNANYNDDEIAVAKDASEKKLLEIICSLMKELLDLKRVSDFKFSSSGIKVTGHWGTADFDELGDGFQATITWVLDLISWWFLKNNGDTEWDLSKFIGIVIIDEIEQHLHPKWQKRILTQIRNKFPSIQFIVTSHSPLVASSDKNIDVCLLKNGTVTPQSTYGKLAENVYQIMGLENSRENKAKENINDYRNLYYKKLKGTLDKNDKLKLLEAQRFLDDFGLADIEKLKSQMDNLQRFLREGEQKHEEG